MCTQNGLIADLQNAIQTVNVTITFSAQMNGSEGDTKRVLTQMRQYARSCLKY